MLKRLELNQFVQFEFDIKGVRQIDACKGSFFVLSVNFLFVCFSVKGKDYITKNQWKDGKRIEV